MQLLIFRVILIRFEWRYFHFGASIMSIQRIQASNQPTKFATHWQKGAIWRNASSSWAFEMSLFWCCNDLVFKSACNSLNNCVHVHAFRWNQSHHFRVRVPLRTTSDDTVEKWWFQRQWFVSMCMGTVILLFSPLTSTDSTRYQFTWKDAFHIQRLVLFLLMGCQMKQDMKLFQRKCVESRTYLIHPYIFHHAVNHRRYWNVSHAKNICKGIIVKGTIRSSNHEWINTFKRRQSHH